MLEPPFNIKYPSPNVTNNIANIMNVWYTKPYAKNKVIKIIIIHFFII